MNYPISIIIVWLLFGFVGAIIFLRNLKRACYFLIWIDYFLALFLIVPSGPIGLFSACMVSRENKRQY